jgi:hypothetical protein
MKGKLWVAVATGLLAASMSYAAPDMIPTDDVGGTPPSTEPTPDNSSMPGQNNEMTNPGGAGAAMNPSSSSDNSGMNSSTGGSDDMSADTATGDDDY